jgi:hypothetical protein
MRKLLFIAFAAISFTSCTTAEFIQHTPTLANTGQHTAKNQFTGRALYSTGSSTSNSVSNDQGPSPYESVNGIQAQGSYSAGDHLAIQAAFMHSSEKGGSEESGNKNIVYNYNRNIAEAGVAYFNALGSGGDFFFELGAGTGFGSYKATENSSLLVPGGRHYDHNVAKLYFQPSVYFVSQNIHLSSGFKFSFINFSSIKTNYTDAERESRLITTAGSLSTTTLDYFAKVEVFTNKLPWIGLSSQVLFSTDLQKKFNTNQTNNNFGIGLCFRFGDTGGKNK